MENVSSISARDNFAFAFAKVNQSADSLTNKEIAGIVMGGVAVVAVVFLVTYFSVKSIK